MRPASAHSNGVSVVYRDKERGTSEFSPFVDIEQFQKLLIEGGFGDSMMSNSLLDQIKELQEIVDYSWLGV